MSYRAEYGLALLLVGLLALALVTGRRGAGPEPDLDFRTSSLSSGSRGAKGVYEVLARLGRPVTRRRTPLFDLADDSLRRPALLLVLDPPLALAPAELAQVVRFLRRGGDVVASGDGGGLARCAGWRVRPAVRRLAAESVAVVAPGSSVRLPRVAWALEPLPPADLPKRMRGHEEYEVTGCGGLTAQRRDTLVRLAPDGHRPGLVDGRPAALRLGYAGGGRLTLFADPGYFENRVWRDTDVAYFLVPLLVPRRPGHVVWDEYHQGEGERGSLSRAVLGWLGRSPAGWAILQLIAVAGVALLVAAARFGPPRSLLERRRRSSLEHVEALAAGLEGAAGTDTAVHLVVTGLRRRLSRAGHLAAGDIGQWLAALEPAVASPRGRAALRRLQSVLHQPGGGDRGDRGERVLAAAHAVEDVWEELRPRSTRD